MQNQFNPPWYRQLWPWLLMSLPLCAVIAGVITLWLAIATDDGLVADDYYKQGMTINRLLYREQMASAMQLQAEIQWHQEQQLISATLSSANRSSLPAVVRVRLLHPGRSGMDQNLLLPMFAPGRYRSVFSAAGAARWHVLLEDSEGTWRMASDWRIPDERIITLHPRR